ncbi:MAG TPA: 50S ribosomal protein L1 [Candidatus Nanoarchaeia archaeon]|nr:50S ribosomal protein L1 [Candidatus Nanoarchaeia archaeon]
MEQAKILEAKLNKFQLDPENQKIFSALKKIREGEKRNFSQTIELIINFKELDVKKEEGKIDEFFILPAGRGKPAKICALIGPEMKDIAAKLFDTSVQHVDFDKLDKRQVRKLAKRHDFFIAQANVMPDVAKFFGRFLSPVGKMPNPKLGQVVPPKANVEPLVKNLRQSIKLVIKKAPVIQTFVGKDAMKDEDLAKNISAVVSHIVAKMPKKEHNIRSVLVKTSMGAPVKI